MWFNTGTLSAYALTLEEPHLLDGYIANYDYGHYYCTYSFVMGKPVELWGWGWVTRRVLFYLCGYPFFKIFGMMNGGMITAFLVSSVAYFHLAIYARRKWGNEAGISAILLLSTYTGIMYWIGSPFAQVMIMPCSIWLYMIMEQLSHPANWKTKMRLWLLAGVLFTAYDLFIFFGPAICMLHFFMDWKAKGVLKIRDAALAGATMLIPQMAVMLVIHLKGAPLTNENSGLYSTIIKAYLHPGDLSRWLGYLLNSPKVFLYNFLDSNFWLLPIFFISWFFVGRSVLGIKFNLTEKCLILAFLLVFSFNNLAPYYNNVWQLRGIEIARIYQPIFVIFLFYLIRLSSQICVAKPQLKKVFFSTLVIYSLAAFVVNTGSGYLNPITQKVYSRFYMHSKPEAMEHNVKKYGIRLWGFPDYSNGRRLEK